VNNNWLALAASLGGVLIAKATKEASYCYDSVFSKTIFRYFVEVGFYVDARSMVIPSSEPLKCPQTDPCRSVHVSQMPIGVAIKLSHEETSGNRVLVKKEETERCSQKKSLARSSQTIARSFRCYRRS
jgi:hypothetical protein